MELLFGVRVRSESRRLGYLAGVEIDAPSRRVTKIIFSGDGKLGSQAQTRSIDAVRVQGSALVVRESLGGGVAAQPLLLSRSVRVTRGGQPRGHLAGVVVNDQKAVEGVIARHHWWTGRSRTPVSDLDLSQPGEVRIASAKTRAA